MATFTGTNGNDNGAQRIDATGAGQLGSFTGGMLAELIDATGDTFFGLDGLDTITAGGGDDTINGGNGNDTLNGGAGADTINGDAGQDTITGGAGLDAMNGGGDNDTFIIGSVADYGDGTAAGSDAIDGGANNDTVRFNGTGSLVLSSNTLNIETIRVNAVATATAGSVNAAAVSGNFSMIGNAAANTLVGGSGDNNLTGHAGDDTLTGGGGTDTAIYQGAAATFSLEHTVNGWTVIDTDTVVNGDEGTDTLANDVERIDFGDVAPQLLSTFISLQSDGDAAADSIDETATGGESTGLDVNVTGGAGDTFTYSLDDDGSGRFVIDTSGVVTVASGSVFDHETESTVSITVRATSSDGSFTRQTYAIAVADINEAPVSGGDATASGGEDDEAITGSVPAATDEDEDEVTYAVVGEAPAGVTFNSDGTFSYDPSSHQGLDDEENDEVTFQYVANDGDVDSEPATVTITINGANDAPVSGGDATASGGEDDEAITGSVPAAADVDVEDLTYAVVGETPAGVTFNSDGTFSYDPSSHQGLDDEENDEVTFQYVANDGDADSEPATVTITINGANDAPVSGGDATASGGEDDEAITGSVPAATDEDEDEVTYAVVGEAPAGVTFNSDGTFSYDPSSHQGLDDEENDEVTFQYVANDGDADSEPATVTITINGANDAPVSGGDATASGGEDDEAITGSVPAAADVDVEDLTYAVVGETPAGVTFNSDGTFSYDPSSHQGLDDEENDEVTFQYVANDGDADSEPATVTITINGANDAPVSGGDATASGGEDDEAITGSVPAAADVDVEDLTYAVVGETPAGVTFNSDGTFSYDPSSHQGLDDEETAEVTFQYVANDGDADSEPATVTITINGANDAPVSGGDATASGGEDDEAITGSVPAATDEDEDEVTYAVVGETPAGVSFNSDGTFSYDPSSHQGLDDEETAEVTFQYVANDGDADSEPATVTITINGANDAPVSGGDATASGGEDDEAITGSVPAAADVDVEDLTYAVVGETPAGVSFNSDGTFSYAPQEADHGLGEGEIGEVTFQYVANDGTVDSEPATVTITINGVNDAAIISGDPNGEVHEDASEEGETLVASGSFTVEDVDGEDEEVFQATDGPADSDGGFGTYEIDEAGIWSYTLDNTNETVQSLSAGEELTDTFLILTADGTGQLVSINIVGKDDEATIDGDTAGDVTEDDEANPITGLLTIDDEDDGENEFQPQAGFAAAYGTFVLAVDGNWSYLLDNGNAMVNALGDGETLTDVVEVVSAGGTVQFVTITINGANEVVAGDEGDNALSGTPDEDTITGGGGDDTISGLGSNDMLFGEAGEDTVSGGAGDDMVSGGSEDDTLSGNAGKDTLKGDEGDDVLSGGTEDDTLVGGLGADILNGGAGNDIASYIDITTARVKVYLDGSGVNEGEVVNDTFISIESVTGTNLSDVLVGNGDDNKLIGGGGGDTLRGQGGNDVLLGGTGADSMGGGAGMDVFRYTNTNHGADSIIDYNVADDSFEFTGSVFGGLAVGVLDANFFAANLTGAAGDADDRFTYETDARVLRYDADGSGGGAAITIATLNAGVLLTAADIVII